MYFAETSISPAKTPPAVRVSGERGYVLLVFILFAALLVAGLSVIIPKAVFEGRREKEQELIFRGLQYQHAIQLFLRKNGRYPASLDELEKTNMIRFLRKRYRDPMTEDGEWRLIHIGPNGVFMDSLTSTLPSPAAGSASAPGSSPSSQQGGGGLQSSLQMSQSGGLSQPGAGQSLGQPSTIGSLTGGNVPGAAIGSTSGLAPGATQPLDPAFSPSANPGANPSLQSSLAAQGQQSTQGTPPVGAQGTAASSQQSSASQVFGGGAIAGVASKSKNESIRVWNGYSEYDKWEFVYDLRQDPLGVAALSRMGGIQQQQQQQQQQPRTNFPGGFSPNPAGPGAPPSPFSPTPGAFPPPRQR